MHLKQHIIIELERKEQSFTRMCFQTLATLLFQDWHHHLSKPRNDFSPKKKGTKNASHVT